MTRLGPLGAATLSALAIVLFAVGSLYYFERQHDVDARQCELNVQNREAIRNTWNAARDLILAGQRSRRARAETNSFFDSVLKPIPRLRCVQNKPVPIRRPSA